jgi:predicted lipid-binding transport protein (Tim44 family)
MGNGFQFLDIILLAMVAGFVLLRLRNVLGKRTGHQAPEPRPAEAETDAGKVVALPDRRRRAGEPAPARPGEVDSAPTTPASTGLERLRQADSSFDDEVFIAGAKGAYEAIVTAFAKGDTENLRVLLAADVFNDFAGTIRKRAAAGHKMETTLVGFESVEIAEADVRGRIAEVTVRFVTDLISVTRDKADAVVSGSASAIDRVTDLWTFARDVRSRDPNWTLIATSAPA